jgi:hypothetical protein
MVSHALSHDPRFAGGCSARNAATHAATRKRANSLTIPDVPKRKERTVAVAYLQEFTIKDGDTSTTNYDAVTKALNLQNAPDGLLIHTAGFDHDGGVFRIFDVWETREQGEKFINDQLGPIVEPMIAAAAQDPDSDFDPPSRETWYELHDSMTG